MAKGDQQIPDEQGKHHTWGSSTNPKYKGRHRSSDRKPEDPKKEDK